MPHHVHLRGSIDPERAPVEPVEVVGHEVPASIGSDESVGLDASIAEATVIGAVRE